MTKIGTSILPLSSSEAPPADYDRPPAYRGMIREVDVYVPMRDGVKVHKVYHDANRPSHLLLPVIPT